MKHYQPTILREQEVIKPRQKAWAIGLPEFNNECAMEAGPFTTEIEALEWIGNTNSLIYYFPQYGDFKITWKWAEDHWESLID